MTPDKLNQITQSLRFSWTADYIYDIECFRNFFSFRCTRYSDGAKWCYEISDWYHQGADLFVFLTQVAGSGGRMVGFNNVGYDYPMLHTLMQYQGNVSNAILYNKSQSIIQSENRWENMIWERDRFVPQLDLFMIHHFDNKAKTTSLKLLEFNMMLDNIEELPYDPNYLVTWEQSRHLLEYNDHDVYATMMFYEYSLDAIKFREELSNTYGKDMMNHNDTKIGVEIVTDELKKRGVRVHKNNQTIRSRIVVRDILFPYIQFERPEFNQVLEFFRQAIIDPDKIKGFFKQTDDEHTYTSAVIDGFSFDFGAGGIHGSLHRTTVIPNDEEILIDSDVASYYPNIGIKNKLYPEHLGSGWCDAMEFMYHERLRVGKKTAEGNAYKLGLNGGYGKSNDKFSAFLDAQYTMAITINGQLMLCMLAEQLLKIPGMRMVQINTDGLTYICPKQYEQYAMEVSTWWENLTQLELEHAHYERMCIRDVNSYLAVTTDGKIKRIGCYAYQRASENNATRELPWHKNHSAVVVAKAAEAALVHGTNIGQFIRNHDNPYDFYLRAKVPRSAKLVGVTNHGLGITTQQPLQNITRYYVSTNGVELVKIMKPTQSQIDNWNTLPHWFHVDSGKHKCAKKAPSGKYIEGPKPSELPPDRRIGIESGWKTTPCNRLTAESRRLEGVDYGYYITETRKIVDALL